MNNIITVKNEQNQYVTIEILLDFKIEKIGKNYILYTVNDHEDKDYSNIFISEINRNEKETTIIPIKEDEKEMVLHFYEQIKNAL